ncbi:MAG: hypothetical protein II917_07150 [Synergistaceae bacterium]|nr:hypothetical protein [Synergistaceae bacterium]
MKELVPMDNYGIFANMKYEAMVDSRFVAEESGYSSNFRQSNFRQSSYINEQNKKQPCYVMACNGFTVLVR